MSKPSPRQVDAAVERLERLADSFDSSLLEAVGEADFVDRAADQPWLVAGVSDGMGLRVTLAALRSGALQTGVGVYWEPPTLLKLDDDGEPVSPVHWARYENALALEKLAERWGADFDVLSADMMLAPQRGLKGDVKGEIPDFSDEVRNTVEGARRRASHDDLVFIDSVAFGKWICPREGNDPVEVPSVDFEGRVVQTSTKKYHVRGYQETLDTMGRNHGRLLEKFREFGWLGEDTTTAFFTWAGGSQNVEVLEGIYGRGSLGDAKIVAEQDVVEFRLEHGRELGDHAIVRLPAFLSAALMAIPGGGLFGLVSRKTLEDKGVYRDMSELAARMVRRLFDTEWVRSNPLAQIELDSNEVLHMTEIAERVAEAHDRIAEFRAGQPEDERDEPIPLDESRELLEGFVPDDYVDILSRFRPDEQGSVERGRFDVPTDALEGDRRAPAAVTLAAAVESADATVREWADGRDIATVEDEFTLEDGWLGPDAALEGQWQWSQPENDRAVIKRRVRDESGRVVARGTTTVSLVASTASPSLDVGAELGEPVGWRLDLDGRPLGDQLLEKSSTQSALRDGLAAAAFGEANLGRARGGTGAGTIRAAWTANGLPQSGGRIMTYVREQGDSMRGLVVDDDAEAVAAVEVTGNR